MEVVNTKKEERLKMLADVFALARKQVVNNFKNDREIITGMLNFQIEIEEILKKIE